MTQPAHILVADADQDMNGTVSDFMAEQGYRVSAVRSAMDALHSVGNGDIDLVLLDLQLPGEGGLELTRNLREHSDVAIIILSKLADTVDRIIGLEVGADDYLTKPVNLRELLARVHCVLRRTRTMYARWSRDVAHFADWRIDFSTRCLSSPDGRDIPLTGAEFDLLSTFVRHSNRPLSREQLADLAYNRETGPFDRAIDVHVGHLRRKIEVDPRCPQMIKTISGIGYVFATKVVYGHSNKFVERATEKAFASSK